MYHIYLISRIQAIVALLGENLVELVELLEDGHNLRAQHFALGASKLHLLQLQELNGRVEQILMENAKMIQRMINQHFNRSNVLLMNQTDPGKQFFFEFF